jgi:TonB family protein
MSRTHQHFKSLFKLLPAAGVWLLVAGAYLYAPAQEPPPPAGVSEGTGRGIELYRNGDLNGAVKTFKQETRKNKNDADAWYYLGLTYEKREKRKDALKAFEKAIIVSFSNFSSFSSHMSAASVEEYKNLNPEGRRAARRQFAAYYARAAESVENYIRLRPEAVGVWGGQLESLRAYARGLATETGADAIFTAADVSQNAVILSRPEPLYTERARQRQTNGYVRMRIVLAADGTVRNFLVLKALPDGLTEQAVNAARRITFTPALRDGRPVSQYVTIDYNFIIY